jgi:predicted kinase
MEAIIFTGVQGAGKSTFYRERFFDTHLRISLDLLKTRHRERLFIDACLASGQRFVIDNTNVRAAERAVYIEAVRRTTFRVIGYFFDAPMRDALRRNGQRAGAAKIPVAGVIGTFKRLERPTLGEGFDELYMVSHDAAGQFVITQETPECIRQNP